MANPASSQPAAAARLPPGALPAARLPLPADCPSLRPCRAAATMPRAQIDVLIADIGGTNCRFQVWQLDTHFRPSRMVVEQVGRRGAGCSSKGARSPFIVGEACWRAAWKACADAAPAVGSPRAGMPPGKRAAPPRACPAVLPHQGLPALPRCLGRAAEAGHPQVGAGLPLPAAPHCPPFGSQLAAHTRQHLPACAHSLAAAWHSRVAATGCRRLT